MRTHGYNGRYNRVYRRLKAHGHCAAKAIEIIIDAKRGDAWSINWIRLLRRLAP